MRSLLLVLLIPGLVLGDDRFRVIKETYRGREHSIHVPSADRPITKEDFADEILLGITSNGHFYLIVADRQITGNVPPIPGGVFDRTVHRGLLIRFPDIPKERVRQVREKLGKESRFDGWSWSCVDTACTNLRRRANTTPKGGWDGTFLTTTFDKILQEGFTDTEGRPVRFEIYKTHAEEADLTSRSRSLIGHDVFYTSLSALLMFSGIVLANEVRKWALTRQCFRHFRTLRAGRDGKGEAPQPERDPDFEEALLRSPSVPAP